MHGRKMAMGLLVTAVTGFATTPALADGPYEPNNSAEAATPLPASGVVSGAIETGNDWDYYKFYARGERQVTVQLTAPAPLSSCWVGAGLDGGVNYVDADLTITEEEPADSAAVTLKEGGAYVVAVRAMCTGAAYTFSVSPADAVSPVLVTSRSCQTAKLRTDAARSVLRKRTAALHRARTRAAKRATRRAIDRAKINLREAKATEAAACSREE